MAANEVYSQIMPALPGSCTLKHVQEVMLAVSAVARFCSSVVAHQPEICLLKCHKLAALMKAWTDMVLMVPRSQ